MKNVSQAAARVYAQALFDIGLETGTVGEIYDDLHAAYNALNGLDADLLTFFNLPQFRRDEKRRIINLAFEGKVGATTFQFIELDVERDLREGGGNSRDYPFRTALDFLVMAER